MLSRLPTLLTALLLAAPIPAFAQADPALTQAKDAKLAAMVPAATASQPFTAAIALGAPPDNFRNEKGRSHVGWEIRHPPRRHRNSSASNSKSAPPPSTPSSPASRPSASTPPPARSASASSAKKSST